MKKRETLSSFVVIAAADQYKIRPRKSRDGYDLESDRLSTDGLWYDDMVAAVRYAKFLSRENGCRIEILDENENVIRVDEFPAGNFAYQFTDRVRNPLKKDEPGTT